jgi:hypothetical protein
VQLSKAWNERTSRYQPQRRARHHAWKQGLPGAKRYRAHLYKHLIKKAVVMELTCQLSTADDPDVLARRRRCHLRVHGPDVPAGKPNVRTRHRGQ